MRRYIGIVFLCVAVMVALLGCDRAEESAEKVYIAYLEACKVSAEAPLPYCHYEHEILRGYAADIGEGQLIDTYRILERNKINKDLYEFTTEVTDRSGDQQVCYQFVGRIDGEFYVMINTYEIPAELQEGLNVDDYTYYQENTLPIEDVWEQQAEEPTDQIAILHNQYGEIAGTISFYCQDLGMEWQALENGTYGGENQ